MLPDKNGKRPITSRYVRFDADPLISVGQSTEKEATHCKVLPQCTLLGIVLLLACLLLYCLAACLLCSYPTYVTLT